MEKLKTAYEKIKALYFRIVSPKLRALLSSTIKTFIFTFLSVYLPLVWGDVAYLERIEIEQIYKILLAAIPAALASSMRAIWKVFMHEFDYMDSEHEKWLKSSKEE